MEDAVAVGICAGGIEHFHVVHHHGIRSAGVVLHGDVPGVGGGGVANGCIFIQLKFVDPDGAPSGVIRVGDVQLHIPGGNGGIQIPVGDVLFIARYRVCGGEAHGGYPLAAFRIVAGEQGLPIVRGIGQVKGHGVHVHAFTGTGTVGVIDHPAADFFVFAQVNDGIASAGRGAPLAIGDYAVVNHPHGAVIGAGYATNRRGVQGQVGAFLKHGDKAVRHFFRPGDGEPGHAAFDAVFGIGHNLKVAGGFALFLLEAAQVECIAGGGANEFPGTIGMYPVDPVHEGILRRFPVYPGFHGLVRGVDHLVQGHLFRGGRGGVMGGEAHLAHIDGVIGYALRCGKPQGDGDGRLTGVFGQIHGGGVPLAVGGGFHRVELEVLCIVGIAEAQAQFHVHAVYRGLVDEGKLAVLGNGQLGAVELDVVGQSSVHGAGELHGGAAIPGVFKVNDSVQLLAVGFDDPAPGGQHIGEGAVGPTVFLANDHAVFVEAVAVASGEIGDKVGADHRGAVSHQTGKAAEFVGRPVGRGGVKGGTDPQLLILHIDEVGRAGRGGHRAGGGQNAQGADQLAVGPVLSLQPGDIVAALGAGSHRPVFPGRVDVPGIHTGGLSRRNGAGGAGPAAGHIQPPMVGDPGVAVLHPAGDAAGADVARAVIPGNGKIIRLVLLQVDEELTEAGNAGTRLGIKDVTVKAVVLGDFNELIGSNEIAVLVLLHHFLDETVAIGAVAPGQENGAGGGHAVAVGRVDHLGRGDGNGAFRRGAAPEVKDVYVLEIIKGIDEIFVSALGRRLAGPGIGHGQRHHLGIPRGQRIDIGAHPPLPKLNGASVIPGVGVVVGTPILQLIDLETGAIGL